MFNSVREVREDSCSLFQAFEGEAPINKIPAEMIYKIFDWLNVVELFKNQAVSKTFQSIGSAVIDDNINAAILKGPEPGHTHPSQGSPMFFMSQEFKVQRLLQERDRKGLVEFLSRTEASLSSETKIQVLKNAAKFWKKWGDNENSDWAKQLAKLI